MHAWLASSRTGTLIRRYAGSASLLPPPLKSVPSPWQALVESAATPLSMAKQKYRLLDLALLITSISTVREPTIVLPVTAAAQARCDSSAAAFQAAKPQFPEQEQNLRCPRCDSTNTKFCYYNNYNLSQPRHFCKSCRRYWTKGGALRNIPVGGGTRKNSKRSNSYSSSAASNSKRPNPPKPPSSLPDLPKPDPVSLTYPPLDPDRHLLDMTGSFSSLLASDGHFESFLGSFHPVNGGATALQNSSTSGNAITPMPAIENFERLEGDSGCWDAGWTDLAI
ncbi:unnamed protein product [Musa hybrid cultivar]